MRTRWNGNDNHLNPPDPITWAECEICMSICDLGDMKEIVPDEIYVCNTCVKESADEYKKLMENEND